MPGRVRRFGNAVNEARKEIKAVHRALENYFARPIFYFAGHFDAGR
jgi:hypothetical protein